MLQGLQGCTLPTLSPQLHHPAAGEQTAARHTEVARHSLKLLASHAAAWLASGCEKVSLFQLQAEEYVVRAGTARHGGPGAPSLLLPNHPAAGGRLP